MDALGSATDSLQLPGIARVIAAFLLVAALAFGAAWALRRILPRMSRQPAGGGRIRVLGRQSSGFGLTVHLLEVDGARVFVAENKAGLSVTLLTGSSPSSPDSPS